MRDRALDSYRYPLALGTVVKPYGKVSAVLITGGERYYLLSKGRCVSMIPAFMIEAAAYPHATSLHPQEER